MFLTPLFEIRNTPNESFVSLSYDSADKKNITKYKYADFVSDPKVPRVSTVTIPKKAFDSLVLASFADGSVLVMDKDGKISKRDIAAGI